MPELASFVELLSHPVQAAITATASTNATALTPSTRLFKIIRNFMENIPLSLSSHMGLFSIDTIDTEREGFFAEKNANLPKKIFKSFFALLLTV
jgi:hypothetical protein